VAWTTSEQSPPIATPEPLKAHSLDHPEFEGFTSVPGV